jgi:hypothetical protein
VAKKLTIKQEAFFNAYIATGNACEAYRRAYDATNMSDMSIAKEAKLLLDHPLIAPKLVQVSERAEVKALLSLEEHMEELKSLREMSKQNGQLSAAITAEVKRGELRRFYVKQIEQGDAGEFARMSTDELREYVYGDKLDQGHTKH